MTPPPPRRKETQHGDDYLDGIESIEITLEDRRRVVLRPADEFKIPTDARLLEMERRRAPARYAFWSYQAERALDRVRIAEHELEEKDGEKYLVYRKWYQEETTELTVTEGMIKSRVAIDSEIKSAKSRLTTLKREYGFLRVMRDGLRERVFILQNKTAQLSDAHLEA